MAWMKERTAREKALLERIAAEGGVPNLDCMVVDDLETFAGICPMDRVVAAVWPRSGGRTYAADRQIVAVFHLQAYALGKAAGMRYRLDGAVKTAIGLEARLDEIYNQLPGWARW